MAQTNTAAKKLAMKQTSFQEEKSAFQELRRLVMTAMLFEKTYYDSGFSIANDIAKLCAHVNPLQIAHLAVEARTKFKLRHVPLFLIVQLTKFKGEGALVERVIPQIIQRADELSELVAMYWKYGRRPDSIKTTNGKFPLTAGMKRGLATAFQNFNGFQLAKYNRDAEVKLRDVLFLVHAKPVNEIQAQLWKSLIDGTLPIPETWETMLSAGKDKKATFEYLLREKKLGGIATLRNLRNMQEAGVAEHLITERLLEGADRAFPYQFITAARHAPRFEDALEQGLFRCIEGMEKLPGRTGLLVDVSGSMDYPLSAKSEATRVDAAAGLAIILREKAEQIMIATFSHQLVEVPGRRGFALRDAIKNSQPHAGTLMAEALKLVKTGWEGIERVIVITDEQPTGAKQIVDGFADNCYLINVAPKTSGVEAGNGWTRINGWSEAVLDYIRVLEEN